MSLISAFAFWLITWRAYPHSLFLGNLFLVFASIYLSLTAIIFLSIRKRIFLEYNKCHILFLWGFFPFVKTVSLDSSGLNVNTEKNDMRYDSKREYVYLTCPTYVDSRIIIIKSKRHKIILSVFEEIKSFINKIPN